MTAAFYPRGDLMDTLPPDQEPQANTKADKLAASRAVLAEAEAKTGTTPTTFEWSRGAAGKVGPPLTLPMVGNDDKGKVHKVADRDSDALERWLHHHGLKVRWELRTRQIQWNQSPLENDEKWETLDNRTLAWMVDLIQAEPDYRPPKRGGGRHGEGRKPAWTMARFEQALGSYLVKHQVDGFGVWLGHLPAWDGVERVESLVPDVLGAPDGANGELARWAGRHTLVSAIHLVRTPGAPIRQVPVLVGPQNCGKSAMIRELFPHWAWDWHGDDLTLTADSKAVAEAIGGRVIVEIAEMIGAGRADLDRLKAMITRRDYGQHRAAYARVAESSPRRAVFIGTANDDGVGVLPDDPSGQTRFVPVKVTGASSPVEPQMKLIRGQLWAEALHRWRSGEWSPGMDRAMGRKAEKAARSYERGDRALWEKLESITTGEHTLDQVAVRVGLVGDDGAPLSQGDANRLGRAMKSAGWTKTRTQANGSRSYLWSPAKVEESF